MAAYTIKVYQGDIVRNHQNTGYELLTGKDKVDQDVRNILTTGFRTTTGLGCSLDDVIGADSNNPTDVYTLIPNSFEFQNRVRIGLSRLRQTQRQYLFSQRDNQELIFDYSPIQFWKDRADPRDFHWRVDILTNDGSQNIEVNGRTRL